MPKKADKTPKAADKDKTRLIERGFMPAVILTIIAVVSITLLALTEYTTADARAYQEQFMVDTNKRAIFIDADSFPAEELDRAGASLEGGKAVDFSGADSIIKEVYLAEKDGSTIGLLITVKPGGYGGTLNMMLGYDLEGNAVGLTIDASTQTAGLGSKVGEDNFIRQFSGFKAADTVSSDNTADFQVDGISGATISSNAVFKGINAGNKAAQQMLGLE